MRKTIEIIATTIEDARRIEKAGADRIELVSALSEGGLTPSYALIQRVIEAVNIPVNVMIRPHSKSFVYTDEEIRLMKQDIIQAKKLGANGVVFGVLTPSKEIDVVVLQRLLDVCDGLAVTFHRAIDETNVVKSVQLLAQYEKVTTILTSGGLKHPIADNAQVIKAAIAGRGHLEILLGGGLTLGNIAAVQGKTGAQSFHFGTAVRVGQEIDEDKIRLVKKLLSAGDELEV